MATPNPEQLLAGILTLLALSPLEEESDPRALDAAVAAASIPPSAQLLASRSDEGSSAGDAAAAQPASAPRTGCILSLSADAVRAILARLNSDDLVNARLACKAFRDQSDPPAVKRRSAYLRTRSLAAYAWAELPGYLLPRTQELWQELERTWHPEPTSTSFKMCTNLPGMAGVMALTQALHKLPQLQELSLCVNNLEPLTKTLHLLPQLRKLDIGSNQLGANGVEALADALQSLPHLQTLDVGHNRMGVASVAVLARALHHVPQLQELDLSATDMGAAGVAELAPELRHLPRLRVLNLMTNELGAAGARTVAQELPQLPRLQKLSLGWNNIGDDGATAIAQALRHVPELKELTLTINNINLAGYTALAQALPHLPQLRGLNLCDMVNPGAKAKQLLRNAWDASASVRGGAGRLDM